MATEKNNIKKLGIIEIDVLENGTGLMKDETNLTFVNCPFPKLTNSTEMFMGCSNLQTFASSLPKLAGLDTFKDMFKNANSLTGFQCGNSTTFTANSLGVTATGKNFIETSALSKNLITFEVNMPNVIEGAEMFSGFTKLEEVDMKMDSLVYGSNMFKDCSKLRTVVGEMPKLTDGTNMFRECSSLETIDVDFDNLSEGISMFYACSALSAFACKVPKLTDGYNMFRYCSSLSNDSILTENFTTTYIVDGFGMFQGTAISQIPWTFPSLVRSRQMFSGCKNITGHLQLDMKSQFPQVSKANLEAAGIRPEYPTAHMFYACSIASINFDVSSLDDGISMFSFCDQLTTCTGAVFQQGGNYGSMFTESRFDLESALLIFEAAKAANVSKLHIGIADQLTDGHPFVIEHQLVRESQGYDEQWMTQSGNVVFVCHPTDVQTASIDDGTNHPPLID